MIEIYCYDTPELFALTIIAPYLVHMYQVYWLGGLSANSDQIHFDETVFLFRLSGIVLFSFSKSDYLCRK